MINLRTDEGNARRYTDALYDFLVDSGMVEEDNYLLSALYWLSDDDCKRFAELQYEIAFDKEEEEV